MNRKIFLIGLDGASWRVINPLLKKGKLPTLAGLIENGVSTELNNLGFSKSPAIWTTIATGKMPEDHGIDDFTVWALSNPLTHKLSYSTKLQVIPGKFKLLMNKTGLVKQVYLSSLQRKVPALWNMLTKAECSVDIMNWWATYPAEEVNGCILSDHANYHRMALRKDLGMSSIGAKEAQNLQGVIYPDYLIEDLVLNQEMDEEKLLSRAQSFVELKDDTLQSFREVSSFTRGDPVSILKFSLLQDEFAINATHRLLELKGQPNFLALYLGGLDAISHYFWKYYFPEDFSSISDNEMQRWGRTLPEYYSFYDRVVSKFIKVLDNNTTVIVVSDHGFESVKPEGSEGPNSGSHANAPNGIFIAAGPLIENSSNINISTLDLVPTLLHLYNLPVGGDMPGRVIEEMVNIDRPVDTLPSWDEDFDLSTYSPSVEAEERIKDRLKALGYLDDD